MIFDMREIPHEHLLDGSIIRKDTKEKYDSKCENKTGTITDSELKTAIKQRDSNSKIV